MQPVHDRFPTAFDKLLIGALGCGVIGLCVLAGGFFFVSRQLSQPHPTATLPLFGNSPTGTPGLTETLAEPPTITATETAASTSVFAPPTAIGTLPATAIPSPVPGFGNSPPAGKIVFTCFVKQIDQVCIMNADGSGRKQLTNYEATTFYASLSLDVQKIYLSSRRNGTFDIYSINLDGGGRKRLTDKIGSLYAPELSPNGDQIVFVNESGRKQTIWLMQSNGKNPHPITNGPDDVDPTWSPDGSMIAFASTRSGPTQLFIMNADGSDIRQVTNLPDVGGRSSWSPDGTKLVFYAGPAANHNIYIINVDGSGLVQLTNGGDNLGPSWSPDGNWIAFTSFRDGNNEIYIMHPDGTAVTRLTNNPASDWQPQWGR